MVPLNQIDLLNLENALEALKRALKKDPPNEFEKDAVIKRFEFTFELSWKMMRKFLQAFGKAEVSGSPKPILRDALEEHLINDLDKWFDFLDARNTSTHIYNEQEADKIYRVAKNFPLYVDNLLKEFYKRKT